MLQATMAAELVATLTPDCAVLLLTVGVLLIYVELNRPGWVLPGALGLLTALLAVAALFRYDLRVGAIVLVITGVVLLLLDLFRRTPFTASIAATLALILGLNHLVGNGPAFVHISVAVACGLIVGAGTSILTRIARRARTNKGLD